MGSLPAPSMPLTTVPITNPYGDECSVTITGGTVTAVTVNGTQVASGTGVNVAVPPGGTIAITYSAAPAWTWTNPIDLSFEGYAGENTSTVVGADQGLPYGTGHPEAGEPGLGDATSN